MSDFSTFKTSAEFFKEIDNLVQEKRMEYVDAIIHYCNQNNVEIETAASIIKTSMVMKAKIQVEAEASGHLRRTAKLPL